jgi:hypothetical protein
LRRRRSLIIIGKRLEYLREFNFRREACYAHVSGSVKTAGLCWLRSPPRAGYTETDFLGSAAPDFRLTRRAVRAWISLNNIQPAGPDGCDIILPLLTSATGCVRVLKLLQIAFYDLIRTVRILFHETMGAVFLVIGIVITLNGYKQLRRYFDFGEISHITIISTFTFGILMLGYGIHSFYQARKMK